MNKQQNRTLMERLRGPIPDYYDTMYLDGYEPYEILQAGRDTSLKEYYEKREQKQEEYPKNIKVEMVVKKK